jgi:lysophospholipid acyltransferase (LPLAT)-like uncharacterized protein
VKTTPPTAAADDVAPPRFNWRQRFTLAVVPPLAAFIMRLLGSTLRYSVSIEDEAGPEFAPGTVYAFWHQCLFTASHRYRNRDIAVLISRSFDGELIARVVEKFGYRPVRGSSSRGAVAGLLEMGRELQSGRAVALTVDGPRGPRFVAKPGPVLLARNQGAPLRALHFATKSSWRLNSWDGFVIPKPFTSVLLRMATPMHLPSSATDQQIDEFHQQLQRELDAARQYAEEHVGK